MSNRTDAAEQNTKEQDKQLETQNSDILVKRNETTGHIDYLGVLIDIIQLNYLERNSVVLFKCDW